MFTKILSLLLFLLSVCLFTNSQTPSWEWAKNGITGNGAAIYSNCFDPFGNVYVTGGIY